MDPCKCEYWCNDSGSCDYERLTGRKLPCEPGKDCDFNPARHPGSKTDGPAASPRMKRGGKKAAWDTARGMELYEAGMTDTEIADAVGANRAAVTNWRYRNELRANKKLIVSNAAEAEDVSTPYVYTGDMPAEDFIALQEQAVPAAMTAGTLGRILGGIPEGAKVSLPDIGDFITGCYVRTAFNVDGIVTETEVILFGKEVKA